MKPVENRFTEVSEIPLRDSYSFTTVREECGRLGRMDALFDEKMRHPLGRLLLEPMHEGKGMADALSWQTFADDDFEPALLKRRCIGCFDVRAIDADGLQRMTLRQSELVELRLHRQGLMRFPIATLPRSGETPRPD